MDSKGEGGVKKEGGEITEEQAEKNYEGWLEQVREEDISKIRELLKFIEDFEEKGKSIEEKASYLVSISSKIRDISYKKWSIKDRYKDIAWFYLEYFGKVVEKYKKIFLVKKMTLDSLTKEEKMLKVVEEAIPKIFQVDIPQLKERLEQILLDMEKESSLPAKLRRGEVTLPPFWGFTNITKLSSHFLDKLQLETIIDSLQTITSENYSPEEVTFPAFFHLKFHS